MKQLFNGRTAGLITALPCRLIHSPGLEASELEIDAKYWAGILELIRSVEGKEKISGYIRSTEGLKKAMNQFEKPDFKILAISRGDPEIRQTVRVLEY